MISNRSFDNTATRYNVTAILSPEGNFDEAAYKAYSPLFIPAAFAISYGLSFASITATLTHTFLYYRKQIWTQARRSIAEQPDIHARLMSKYPQVPEWWYGIIFLTMFVFGIVVVEVWHTGMPVYAFVIALLICMSITPRRMDCANLRIPTSYRPHGSYRYHPGHHLQPARSQRHH